MQTSSERAIFANQLRAIAIIAVILVHWFGVFWLARETVAEYIFAPPPEGPPSRILDWISFPTLNYGPFGVSIFFLISGFVIPFSLARSKPLAFLVSRVFRIYPTYIVATAISLTCVWISSRYWGSNFIIDLNTLIRNLALIHSNTYYRTIDLVNWSLCVELKFYIVCALMYKAVGQGAVIPILLFSILVLAAVILIPKTLSPLHIIPFDLSIESIKVELMLVVFMLIGTCFYHHYVGNINSFTALISGAELLIICLACWPNTEWSSGVPYVPLNYLYGLIIFTASYRFRSHFKPFAPLDFIAKISYPLYIVHSLIGYSAIRLLMGTGLSFRSAVAISFAGVVLISYLLHLTVETWSHEAGKKLIKYGKQISWRERFTAR